MSIAEDDYWSPEAIRARDQECAMKGKVDVTMEGITSASNRPPAARKPIAIAPDGDGTTDTKVLCDDGSLWMLRWAVRGWQWDRIPDVPQDEDEGEQA